MAEDTAEAETLLQGYRKIEEFLNKRNLTCLLSSFVCHKIDDDVAADVSDSKLSDIGLLYGDILSYRHTFKPKRDTLGKSYEEKAEELRRRLRKTHNTGKSKGTLTTKKDTFNVTFSLKCIEKKTYVLKRNQTYIRNCQKEDQYHTLLFHAKEHFQIVGNCFLGDYNGKTYSGTFDNLEHFAMQRKNKKKAIHMYLHYPHSYTKLQLKLLASTPQFSDDDDQDDFDIFFQDLKQNPTTMNNNSQISTVTSNSLYSAPTQNVDSASGIPFETSGVMLKPTTASANSDEDVQIESCAASTSGKRALCTVCYCTYIGVECLICKQNEEYSQSLAIDQLKDSGSSGDTTTSKDNTASEDDNPSLFELRSARLTHFRRRQVPARFRHSIGSPSLSTAIKQSNYEETEEAVPFGNNEVIRFFDSCNDIYSNDTKSPFDPELPKESILLFIEKAKKDFDADEVERVSKHVIVQRDPERFWPVILRQTFDLKKENISVRFAGEAATDLGGPQREFLTLAMERFHQIPGIFVGSQGNAYLRMIPESIVKGHYFLLGQLTGLAILSIGRGCECFNLLVLQAMYNIDFGNQLPQIDDKELEYKLTCVENGDVDSLLELGITPTEEAMENKKLLTISFVILRNFGAIDQFLKGLKNVHVSFGDSANVNVMKSFLMPVGSMVNLQEFLEVIDFHKEGEEGSNVWNTCCNLVCDVEIFFASVANNEIDGISLSDILFLFTGLRRIPPFGLQKNIDIYFSDVEFPKISTCGYIVTLPLKDVEKSLNIAVNFGDGFGAI